MGYSFDATRRIAATRKRQPYSGNPSGGMESKHQRQTEWLICPFILNGGSLSRTGAEEDIKVVPVARMADPATMFLIILRLDEREFMVEGLNVRRVVVCTRN